MVERNEIQEEGKEAMQKEEYEEANEKRCKGGMEIGKQVYSEVRNKLGKEATKKYKRC